MSLNGLDDVKVKEAFEIAAAEPGGWFLLKYAARDEIELLERGNGGIVEIRNVMAKYEEPSPLFGFLRYRRRNVLIKYVPDACSRLVQARLAVHFRAIAERFTPHDTVFPISTAKELRDTELSAACSLHTASGSTSSSTDSLRRRRLMEIAEDEEERKISKEAPQNEHPLTAKAPSVSSPEPPSPPKREVLGNLQPSSSYLSTKTISSLDTTPPPPREPTKPNLSDVIAEARKSSQSTRPELYSYSSYGSNGKPKVKLAPRPSLDANKRPHTSTAASFYRPVSTLPQGIKMSSKGPKKDKPRPQSQYDTQAPTPPFRPPPIPEADATLHLPNSRPHTSGGRPNTSSGASLRSPAFKGPAMTPEKARLMKAMELRKKRNAVPQGEPTPSTSNQDLKSPEAERRRVSSGAPKEVHDTLAMLDHMANGPDSSIAFDATSTMKTDESDATRSDSSPVSPIGASEAAGSTRASSVSESTDETIQERSAKKSPVVAERSEPEALNEYEQSHIGSLREVEEPVFKAAKISPIDVEEVTGVQNSTVETELNRHEEPQASAEVMSGSKPSPADDEVSFDETLETSTDLSDTVSELGERSPPDDVLTKRIECTSTEQLETPPRLVNTKVNSEPKTAQASPTVKEWKVPRSKFSSQNLAAKEPLRSKFSTQELTVSNGPAGAEDSLSTPSSDSSALASQSAAERRYSKSTRQSLDEQDENVPSVNVHKRRGFVEPIKTDFGSDDRHTAESVNFSSDDELMDELQSAVVQEAKPIPLPKTPMSPVMPSLSPKKKPNEQNRFSRAFSMPLQAEESDPKLLTPSAISNSQNNRAVSAGAAYLNRINSQSSSKPIPKKNNLGSGISQRIKALEKLSNTDTTNTEGTRPVSTTSTAFFSVRKSGPRPSSSSQSIKDRADSLTRSTPSPGISRESSPQSTSNVRDRSGSIQTRVEAFNSSPNQSGHSKRESVSVIARIVRDPGQPFQPKTDFSKDPSDSKPLNLKKSPLEIDHQKATKSVKTPQPEPTPESRPSTAPKTSKERRSSITIVKDMINEKRSSFAERRRSITIESSDSLTSPRPPSTHSSPSYKPRNSTSSRQSISGAMSPPRTSSSFSPPPSVHSPMSPNEDKDKKANRASRMIRRMSSSLSSSRKSLAHAISPTVREDPEPPVIRAQPSPTFMTPTSIPIGDVNVQFPDTLLWKRRCVLLDPHQCFLILSPALTATSSNKDKAALGATRKFHFGDFKRIPSIPDVEMQELPNSVVVELSDGSGLQIACEDRAGQKVLLNVLQEAYRSLAASPR